MIGCQTLTADGNASMSTRTREANAAALTPVAMNPATGVGEPSYTSGAHMWNGTAATLKPKPISRRPRPSAAMSGSGLPESCAPMRLRLVVPVAPYTSAMP